MTKKLLLAIAVAASLAGCAGMSPKVPLDDEAALTAEVKITRDEFKKATIVEGMSFNDGDFYDVLKIRAFKVDGGSAVLYQIYVADIYNGNWKFYDDAYDSNGQRMDFKSLSRSVSSCRGLGCSYIEHIGITVTRDYLEKSKSNGIRFKVSGKGGDQIFNFSGAYVRAFLNATAKL